MSRPRLRAQRGPAAGVAFRRALLVLALGIAAIPFVFPFWWMITSSFKSISEIFGFPPSLLPERPTLTSYRDVFTTQPFAQQYWNSLYIAAIVTVATILISAMAGYAFARIRFPGVNIIFVVILLGLLVPTEVTIVPLFQMVTAVGLMDTHWPLIIIPTIGAPSVIATFIMRQFFLALPVELEEAGRLDGLGRAGIFWHIAFPLARPASAAVGIFTFLHSWNTFLEPVVFLSSKERFTLPQALNQYVDANGPIWNTQLAATTLTVLPVLIVFLLAQREFIQGITQAGLKG